MRRSLRWLLLAALAGGLVVGLAPAASADHLEVEVVGPGTVEAGDIIEMEVVVRSAETGQPVPGATVVAEREASIVGISGRVQFASTTTDDLGVATLRWREHSGAADTIILAYAAVGDAELESDPQRVITVAAGPQIIRSEAGVKIPGFGAWILIGILVSVWAIIQFAMVGPVQVAREGLGRAEAEGREPLP